MFRRLAGGCLLAATLAACTVAQSDIALVAPSTTPISEIDDLALRAHAELEFYWSARYPDLFDEPFAPIGAPLAYGDSADDLACGQERFSYADVAANAFYCPIDDFVAWDDVGLIQPLREAFGDETVGLVIAHEFAHAIQVRAERRGPSVVIELQADCLAGAWVASVDPGSPFAVDDMSLQLPLTGLLQLRDGIGTSARNANAHGSGLDRISAFLDGLEGGDDACLRYQDDPPEVVAIPFNSRGDFDRGGNLPVDQLLPPLLADLEAYFDAVVDSVPSRTDEWQTPRLVLVDAPVPCRGTDRVVGVAGLVCPDFIAVSVDAVARLAAIGDFAVGGDVARLFAETALADIGVTEDVARRSDCLVGNYSRAAFDQSLPDPQLLLSPGDLDEVILTYLTADPSSVGDRSNAVARVQAFRSGFFDGLATCVTV